MLINHESNIKIKAKAALKFDDLMSQLEGKTPAQIASYVNNNLNNIASMKKFAVMVLLFIQAEKRG